ncbi:DotA/TraY family protein [Pseudomonas sp. NPDC096950]|uniref:DotA/TraY family protein n=1 Tax=Pseudomonas sp. NPDC096950 TaxID=3364485 RepID=UPI00383A2493
MTFLVRIFLLSVFMTGIAHADQGLSGEINALAHLTLSEDLGQQIIKFIAGGGYDSYTTPSLLSTISRYLNTIALCMMGWLTVLGGATYVIQTANKGTPGGQVISSFWMPIRISTALILLIPVPSGGGYSMIQYGVITVAEKGNAVGGAVQAVGIDYLYNFGAYKPSSVPDGSSFILDWVSSEVCQKYINGYTNSNTIVANQNQSSVGDLYRTSLSYDYNEVAEGFTKNNPRLGYCGSISFTLAKESVGESDRYVEFGNVRAFPTQELLTAQSNIIRSLKPKISSIADAILSDEGALRALQEQGESAQSTYESAQAQVAGKISGSVGTYSSAVTQYNQLVAGAIQKYVNMNAESVSGGNWAEQTKQMGWVGLGTIFWQVNVSQSRVNALGAAFKATYTPPALDKDWTEDVRLAEISQRLGGLARKVAAGDSGKYSLNNVPDLSIADAGADGNFDWPKVFIYRVSSYLFESMAFDGGNSDLLVNMQYYGAALNTTAETLVWLRIIGKNIAIGALKAVEKTADTVGNTVGIIPGVGNLIKAGLAGVSTFAATTLVGIIGDLAEFLGQIILYLIIVGFILAVVLPTIPLVFWFMGVISWFLFFIECLLISPTWLAAHGTAEKEGWGTEHTRQGYMLMIGLFMAPTIRVSAFLAVFLALRPLGVFVEMMIQYLRGVVVHGPAMLTIQLGTIGLVAIFAYTGMVRIFSLPNEMFEKGLRWVNGGQEVTGDSGAEQQTRSNMVMLGTKGEQAGGALTRSKPTGGAPKAPTNA